MKIDAKQTVMDFDQQTLKVSLQKSRMAGVLS